MNSHSSHTTDHGTPSHSAGTTTPESTAHNAESRYELPPIPGPKYEQVIHYIEQRYIIPGKPGDKLPTERMIQQNFGVSRQTVRSALKVLIERGLLYNVQGSGTYVAERTDATYIPRVDTFVDDMRRRGFEGSTRMMRPAGWTPPKRSPPTYPCRWASRCCSCVVCVLPTTKSLALSVPTLSRPPQAASWTP